MVEPSRKLSSEEVNALMEGLKSGDLSASTTIKDGKEICLITNLTNSMQNASKVVLYLTLKDAIIES